MEQLEKAVKRARKGEKEAFEIIYMQTHKNVYYTCLSILKNEQDAEDVMQDSYVAAIKSIDSLEDDKKIISWINVIAANKCRNVLKKKMPELMEEEVMEGVALEENELHLPEEYIVNKAKREIVMDIIKNKLSDVLYQTVILYYFNNISVPEIAKIMECPTGTVTYRLSVARAKIKEGIEKYQKDNNEKLYSVTLLPFLPLIFKEDAKAAKGPNVCADIIIKASDNSAVQMAEQVGGKVMLKTLKAKIIAGAVGAAGIVTAVVAAIVIVNAMDEEELNDNVMPTGGASTEYVVEEQESSNREDGDDEPSDETKVDDSDEPSDENNIDNGTAREMVTYIYEQLGTYIEAIKEGDIDTIVKMTSEESEDYPYLVEMAKYEDTRDFLKSLYSKMVYMVDPGLEEFEYNVYLVENGTKDFYVNVRWSDFVCHLMEDMYYLGLEKRTYIPCGYGISDNSDVIEMIEIAMKNMPMELEILGVDVTIIDEQGTIKIDGNFFSELEFYQFDLEEGEFDENYIMEFWNLWTISIYDEIVGVSMKEAYGNNPEECVVIEELFTNKNFEELINYLNGITGKDYKQLYKEKCENYDTIYLYAEYEMLNESQKQYLAKLIENNVDTYVAIASDEDGKRIKIQYIMTSPELTNYAYSDLKEAVDWHLENDIVRVENFSAREVDFDDFDSFIFLYYQLIGYVYNYVK